MKLENTLTREILKLEENAQSGQNLIEIEEKESQLRMLRQNEMRGQYIRSQTQWIEEGEKPTNFFCNLENKNFVSKTIKKLVIDENVVIDDQKEILKQTKQFYEKLYKKQDCLKKVNLSTEIPYNDIPKLNENKKTIIGRGN